MVEHYLEKNGFEIIEARMTDVIRNTYFCQDEQIRTYHLKKPFVKKTGTMANRDGRCARAADLTANSIRSIRLSATAGTAA